MSLSDTTLKNAKPKAKRYKLMDRDGLFAEVMPSGVITFRFQYWRHGKRERLTLGRYPVLTLKEARKKHLAAQRELEQGKSPAREKQRKKDAAYAAETVKEFAALWLKENDSRPTWRKCQEQWLERDIYPALGSFKLPDVTATEVLALLDKIKQRGADHSALRVRGILHQIFTFAVARQAVQINPVSAIPAEIIAKPQPRERVIRPAELKRLFERLESYPTSEANKIAFKLLLMTMTRKKELLGARWDEIDFEDETWIVPATRMKMGKEHIVGLCKQTIALFKRLKVLACGSEYVLPGAFDANKPMGSVTLNSILYTIEKEAKAQGEDWQRFTLHDFRRTASTFLHERGYPSDPVEKQLSHEKRSVRNVYNKAEWLPQRRTMLAAWADIVDAWLEGRKVRSLTLAVSR